METVHDAPPLPVVEGARSRGAAYMRLQFTGSRNWGHDHYQSAHQTIASNNYLSWKDWEAVAIVLLKAQEKHGDDLTVCEGHADGLDIMVYALCIQMGIEVISMPAAWKIYGKAAGPIRNQQMIDEFKPHHAVAFSHDLTHSRGTKDMVNRLRKAGIPTTIIT